MRLNGTLWLPANVVCSRFASWVRANSISHSRRVVSCATMGPAERTCSISTCTNRSAAACIARPSLIRDDRRRADDVLEHRGPPGQLQFAVHGVHIHPAGVQIADELAESDRLEIAFQAAAFRQRVQRQTVVIQRLETGLDLVEIQRLQIAAGRRGGQDRVQRRQIGRQLLLGVDDVVQMRRQHRPAAREARTRATARPDGPPPAGHRADSPPARPRAAGSWPP